jgi:hypothetical protein
MTHEYQPPVGGYPILEQYDIDPAEHARQVDIAWGLHDAIRNGPKRSPELTELYGATVRLLRAKGDLRRDEEGEALRPSFGAIRKFIFEDTRFPDEDLKQAWAIFPAGSLERTWNRAQEIGLEERQQRPAIRTHGRRKYVPFTAPALLPEATSSYVSWGDIQNFYQRPFIDPEDDIKRRHQVTLTHLPRIEKPWPFSERKWLMHDVVRFDEMPQLRADQELEAVIGQLPEGTAYTALLEQRAFYSGMASGENPDLPVHPPELRLGETILLNAILLYAARRGAATAKK